MLAAGNGEEIKNVRFMLIEVPIRPKIVPNATRNGDAQSWRQSQRRRLQH